MLKSNLEDIRICAEQENNIPSKELNELYFMNSTLYSLEQFKHNHKNIEAFKKDLNLYIDKFLK